VKLDFFFPFYKIYIQEPFHIKFKNLDVGEEDANRYIFQREQRNATIIDIGTH
jgi:hypothetical protein